MIKHTGHADLPLHTGIVPKWLADRMMQMGTLIVESIIENFGKKEVLVRLSDPLWFQSLGAVMGMDWHSSGITTSVMYALKRGINSRAREFGLCVCGGRGKYSRRTPDELQFLADATGLDGIKLINSSKLVAKVDSTAVQDGFQLYMHNFILSNEGDWTVVQQGMNTELKTARRYHWSSGNLRSFIDEPHTGVTGENRGLILNLTASDASPTRQRILDFTKENPDRTLKEIKDVIKHDDNKILVQKRDIVMPAHHEVRAEDVNLKRLGAVLATAYESGPKDFEGLLLTPGLGPRTIQSLTLVSEVIYGTPSRFTDPARFSFAHGGKDGHPFPVPLKVYDESIRVLHESIERSKLGYKDKSLAIKRLHSTALEIEKYCDPIADFDKTVDREWFNSKDWDGHMA
ncbi:DUF763 domain-containing protein [Treponema sp.]|uniref:DUF763 domain-containing protein n=1 Tax=Treponema sp. TaxID=166 RepID=UPI00298EAC53|nr:DUF763 domain-containing protein [Treponema sp.]MCR5614023.1 DUF763 domain-containing protein [Treponema sp.]